MVIIGLFYLIELLHVSVTNVSLNVVVLTLSNITVGYSLMLMLHNGITPYLCCI